MKAEAVIGSGEDNQFVIRRPSVSSRHASLAFRKDRYEIADLDSTNGTFVNGRRITGVTAIKLGDEIRLGDAAFILAKPANAAVVPKRKLTLPKKVVTRRGAFELALLAFAIGFGAAQYLAYLVYHAQNQLILAEAVPINLPGNISAPPLKQPPLANQAAPPRSASPSAPASNEVAAPAVPKPSAISNADAIAAKEFAGGIALAGLIAGSGSAAGYPAPDFTLANLDGDDVTLGAMRGKILLLDFWATWCSACRSELPALQQLYRDLRSNRDFAMLTVNINQDGKSAVTQFMADNGYDFPVLLDLSNATSKAYEVNGIPSNFVIGRNGRIIWNCSGAVDWSDPTVRSALEKLL